jgi:hypothetical protein
LLDKFLIKNFSTYLNQQGLLEFLQTQANFCYIEFLNKLEFNFFLITNKEIISKLFQVNPTNLTTNFFFDYDFNDVNFIFYNENENYYPPRFIPSYKEEQILSQLDF